MCCGQKRATMATQVARHPNPLPAPATLAVRFTVRLRYVQDARLHVRGPVSGSVYECSDASREIVVDARDAVSLEQTGLFQRL